MKRFITSLVIATVLATTAVTAAACPGDKGKLGDRAEKISQKLSLSAEQEAQVRIIMEAKRDSMKTYRAAQRSDTLNKLSSVLTVDQLEEFEKMSERKPHRKGKE